MNTIQLNRGEAFPIPFTIADAANGLIGKRVTASIGKYDKSPSILRKVGSLPGSSADVTITAQSAGAISGTINVTEADYSSLPERAYKLTLWVDDGTLERCASTDGYDNIEIIGTVPRLG